MFFLLFIFVFTLIAKYIVTEKTKKYLFSDVNLIPHNKVGLVLGTSKYLLNGQINLYYQYRIDATVALYNAKKIDFVLISGDNSNENYDEPSTFKADLVALGIPEDKIYLDYAGFRTLDSVVRSKAIFGQDSITIISQKFHNERAVYLALNHNIKAFGFNAQGVTKRYGIKTHTREYLARVKMLLDLLFGKEPKFYGEKIKIG